MKTADLKRIKAGLTPDWCDDGGYRILAGEKCIVETKHSDATHEDHELLVLAPSLLDEVIRRRERAALEWIKAELEAAEDDDWIAENARISALPLEERVAAYNAGMAAAGFTAEEIERNKATAATMPAFVKQCMEVNRLKKLLGKADDIIAAHVPGPEWSDWIRVKALAKKEAAK